MGSSVGMMEKLLGGKSPLFGRRTAQLEIKPVSIFNAMKFLPGYSTEDCINFRFWFRYVYPNKRG